MYKTIYLNLASKVESRRYHNEHLNYDLVQFPDGQQNLTLRETYNVQFTDWVSTINIYTRLNNFNDVETLILAVKALRGVYKNCKDIRLYVPYFIGARSDRKFETGGANYLKDVIAPIINSLDFSSVTVVDPHSDVLEAVIQNFNKVDNMVFIKWALLQIDNTNFARQRIVLISPDAGALKKVHTVVKHFYISNVLNAVKNRDIKTGEILSTEIHGLEKYDKTNKFVIIDDICDGGRTFIELAKEIKKIIPDAELYLVVTHGIFSKGLDELVKYYTKIFTTNSFASLGDFSDQYKEYDIFNQLYI